MSTIGSEILPLNSAYPFGIEHGLASEVAMIRNMVGDGVKKKSSLRRAYIAHLFQERGILDTFISKYWQFGGSPRGIKKLRWYETIRLKHIALLEGDGEDSKDEALSDDDIEDEQSFVSEADLRDFLAHNLSVIEPQLKLYEVDGRTGIEFRLDQGRIDILAVDIEKKFVVIELKLSKGRNKALGQLLYYMGWVDDNLGRGPCRGIIVAADISNELATAVKRVPGVSLFRYRVSLSVEKVVQ